MSARGAASERQEQVRQTRQESRARIVDAATNLVRTRSYSELSVEEVMREAGFGRTIFYRHFDDLADLLRQAGRDAIEELYASEQTLARVRRGGDLASIRAAIEVAVAAYANHGPLLRALAEAAAVDEQIADRHRAMRARFDRFAEQAIREITPSLREPYADLAETTRALNLLNEAYLLDAFGREPRVSAQTAVETLTEVWSRVIGGGPAPSAD